VRGKPEDLLNQFLKDGEIKRKISKAGEVKNKVLHQLKRIEYFN